MSKITFHSIASRIKTNERKRYTHRELFPVREWLIGLGLAIALVVVGAIQSTHQFLLYKNVHTQGGVYEGTATAYSEPIVQRALSVFENRKVVFDQLQKQTETISPKPAEVTASSSEEIIPVLDSVEVENSGSATGTQEDIRIE
jgi:hypothetical protein